MAGRPGLHVEICANPPSPTLCCEPGLSPACAASCSCDGRSRRSRAQVRDPAALDQCERMNRASVTLIAFTAPRRPLDLDGRAVHNLRKPELERRGAIEAVASGSLTEMRRRGFDRPFETIGQIARARGARRPESGSSSPTSPASKPVARPLSAALPPSSSNGGISIAAASPRTSRTTGPGSRPSPSRRRPPAKPAKPARSLSNTKAGSAPIGASPATTRLRTRPSPRAGTHGAETIPNMSSSGGCRCSRPCRPSATPDKNSRPRPSRSSTTSRPDFLK